jgi:hypothetical protein
MTYSTPMGTALVALALTMGTAQPAFAAEETAIATPALPGAVFRIVDAGTRGAGKPCPKSSFAPSNSNPESLAGLAAGLISSFAGKAIDGFSDWLKKRAERLDGTRTAVYTGNFYQGKKMRAVCYIFEAANFRNDGGTSDEKVYIELVPVAYDGGTFTLKPVYFKFSGSVARAGKTGEKYTSLVVSMNYNSPVSVDKDTKEVNQTELAKGPTFTFNFGRLRASQTEYDHQALRGVTSGLGQMPAQFEEDAASFAPTAYEATALWSEAAEPSPLYTAAAGAFSDNTDELKSTATTLVNRVLGIKDKEDKGGEN